MVNYQDPVTIAAKYAALVKFWRVVNGIYIWEFFSSLDYEWDVIRGIRPYQWTIWIYSSARVCTLFAEIINMIGLDTITPINCPLYATSSVILSYSGFVASSLLIILRLIAIWHKNKIVSAISMALWIANIGTIVNIIVGFRASWSHETNSCLVVLDVGTDSLSIIFILFTDVVLLLIMLIGLFRMRLETGNALRLGCLWNEGIVWLCIATVTKFIPVVFLASTLNKPLDFMFHNPSLVAVTIAATSMYRSLATVDSPDLSHDTPLGSVRAVEDLRLRSGPIPLNRIEVSVRTEHDKFPILYVSADQGRYRTQEVSLSGDVESGPEKLGTLIALL